MKTLKNISKTIIGVLNGIFDTDTSKKTTGCCGAYVPKAIISKNATDRAKQEK